MLPPEENDDTMDLDDATDLEPNEDIIERQDPGREPLWLWVQTCPGESCPCRSALVVAANSRERLDAHVAVVRELWEATDGPEEFQAKISPEIVAFELDIDSGDVNLPMSEERELTEAVRKAAEQIDGDLLDHLASQWYLGKEQPDAATIAAQPSEIRDYTPGQLLAWDEVYTGARADIYSGEGQAVEAIETYCVRPKCQCNEVRIQFYTFPLTEQDEAPDEQEHDADSEHGDLDEHVYVGSVAVVVVDPVEVKLVPGAGKAEELERLFARYKARYPSWTARLSKRAEAMAAFGERLDAYLGQQRRKPWVSASRKRRKK